MRPDYWAPLLAMFFFFLLLRASLYPVLMRDSLWGVIYMLTSLALWRSLTEFPTYSKFKLQSGHAYLTVWSVKKSKRWKVAEETRMYRETLHSLLEMGNRKITATSIPRMCPLVLLERQRRALEIKYGKVTGSGCCSMQGTKELENLVSILCRGAVLYETLVILGEGGGCIWKEILKLMLRGGNKCTFSSCLTKNVVVIKRQNFEWCLGENGCLLWYWHGTDNYRVWRKSKGFVAGPEGI